MQLRIGGIEIDLRVSDAEALARLVEPWTGYRGGAAEPDVRFEYHTIDGYMGEQPEDTPYPAYGCRAETTSAGVRYAIWRRDSRGTILVPRQDGPLHCRFEGNPGRWAIEACLRVTMSLALPRDGGLMIHSAGVASERRALLFSGPSGAGKTTISTMLAEHSRERRLGDDLTVARPGERGWIAHATPFAGEAGPVPEATAPLEAMHFLVKAARHRREPLAKPEALRRLMRNVMAYVREREAADRALGAAAAFVAEVPCYILEFARDPGVARVLGVT